MASKAGPDWPGAQTGRTILNKTPITEVIANGPGEVMGALGICVAPEQPELKLFRAKNVILATGNTSRLYPPRTPAWLFNTGNCPVCTGTGRIAAYKVGAKLVNLDMPYTHAGPKYFARCGKATWTGVLKDMSGKPMGPFAAKPTRDGDVAGDIWNGVFGVKLKAGQPIYMDCSEACEETWIICSGDWARKEIPLCWNRCSRGDRPAAAHGRIPGV